MAMKV